MIEVANLSKRYGDLPAVRDVSFTAADGQILGFLGPNGAGKTTTMRIITGFMPATSGTVRVDGFDVFEQSTEVRRRIGYLPENPPLYNDMSVAGFLRFAARLKGVARGDIATALERVLETCGLTGVRDRLLGHLSKGFRQRVGLAQALIHASATGRLATAACTFPSASLMPIDALAPGPPPRPMASSSRWARNQPRPG